MMCLPDANILYSCDIGLVLLFFILYEVCSLYSCNLECKQIICMQLKPVLFVLVLLLKSSRIFDTIVYTHKDLEQFHFT
jgi:hypothetical protein